MQHKKILFVCTGNTCRSPMAEAVLKDELKKRKIRWYTVRSAGLRAAEGSPMSENSVRALAEAGISSEGFRSRQLTEKMVKEAYAVVCMTRQQMLSLGGKNVTCFYELAGREIPDPYGRPLEVYRSTLRAIRDCMPQIVAVLGIVQDSKQ